MTVVIDSGVWISGLRFGGVPLEAVERALIIDRVAICREIELEVIRILTTKMGWEDRRARQSLSLYLEEAIWASVGGSVQGVCRDPMDDAVLECAAVAGADLILTGDQDLLSLGRFQKSRIVTAREYIEL